MHRSVHASAVITVVCWAGAYLLGSIPIGHLLERSRLRHDLRRLEGRRRRAPDDLHALLGGGSDPSGGLPTATEVAGAVLDTAKVVGLALAVMILVRAASPGFNRGEVPASSDLGFVATQVLTVWESASLWAGLAAGVGHLWPVWLGWRGGGQGQAPLLALAVRFTPTGFVVAVAGYLAGRVTGGSRRRAVVISLIAFVAWMWSAWLWDLPHWWGLLHGPETGIWAAVLAGVIVARNFREPPVRT